MNTQQPSQQQQQQQQAGYFNPSQKYTPNAYQPQQHAQGGYMTSPPPLQHPVPTHPPVQMREPAPTPSPRMNYAQTQGSQPQNLYNPNKYRPQQPQQPQQQQQRGSFERSSFDRPHESPQLGYMSPQAPIPQQPYQPQNYQQQQEQQQYQQQQQHQHQQYPRGHIQGQQQQQPQGQGQGQGQGQQGIPSFPFNLNDGTTQLGMQFGKSAVMAGQEYMEQNLNRWVNRAALQHYFNVSNLYVVSKLKLLIFPWRHKVWTRTLKRSETTGEVVGYLPPREDVNSPDLYIPVMAFVTYILLVAVSAGTSNKFSPEILGPTASTALSVILLEISVIKLCTYILNISSEVSMLDLLAYSGYKFVGITVSTVAQLVNAPKAAFWAVFLYTGAATGFFLLRSLRYVILPESSAGTVQAPQRKRRIHFLICLSVLQFAFMWMLV
ncbi:hypothetical protein BG004_000664 [Podila humilis]|nr:hypothetical protein BG004_000664 [Podila humilis]